MFTLERSFLAREGLCRKDDCLQGTWSRGPVQDGRFSGAQLDTALWQEMLTRYTKSAAGTAKQAIPRSRPF